MPEPAPRPAVRARVFCLPYAGGSSLAYRSWPDLGPGVEAVALDYPGRMMRPDEPLVDSVPGLVAALTDELAPFWDTPFVLCGSSLGSLVAFELARAAERAGHRPEAVVLCACAAPGRLPRRAPVTDLPDAEFLAAVTERYDGAIGELSDDPQALELVLPGLRADIRAFERYAARTDPPGTIAADVIAFAGQQDRSTRFGEVAAWRARTTGDFQVRSVPGGHFFVARQPDQVAGEIRARLGRAHPVAAS
ncbi:alpha/beta fold hydrolase [Kitasatospora sp. NPDC004799]|uniref:thioesterase II family protein n=1 Tax=Kitasatospora sp. NPDC004799 TaxID=3154460 RepID=UPI0033AA078E